MEIWSLPRATRERLVAGNLEKLDRFRRILMLHSDMTSAHLRILWLFNDEVPRTLKTIAEELEIDQSTANRQVNSAVDRGYLSKERPDRGKCYLFNATQHGRCNYERSVEYTMDVYGAALEALGDQREAFEQNLNTFVSAFARRLGANDVEVGGKHSHIPAGW